jgi:hypothetical protein
LIPLIRDGVGMGSAASVIERVRQPEYTGENRCLPCTVVNLVIAVVLSALTGYVGIFAGWGALTGGILGGVVFILSVASIYFRGYLVPKTPELTKRYFPEWLLAKFDTESEPASEEIDEKIDVEAALHEAGILEEKPHGDLGLTPEFERAWSEQIDTEREADTTREALAEIVGVDEDGLHFDEYQSGAFMAFYDHNQVGRWESEAAFLADAAAGRVLPEYYGDWDRASPEARGQLLAGLRLFIDECPDCGGVVRFGQEIVESCCRSHQVVAVTCEDCDARLFEIDATEELLQGGGEPA